MDVYDWLRIQNWRLRLLITRKDIQLSKCQRKLSEQILAARERTSE